LWPASADSSPPPGVNLYIANPRLSASGIST
jgi:hypothetical protein